MKIVEIGKKISNFKAKSTNENEFNFIMYWALNQIKNELKIRLFEINDLRHVPCSVIKSWFLSFSIIKPSSLKRHFKLKFCIIRFQ